MTLPLENILFYGVLGLYFGAMILYFLFVAAKKEGLGKAAVGMQTAGLSCTRRPSCSGVSWPGGCR